MESARAKSLCYYRLALPPVIGCSRTELLVPGHMIERKAYAILDGGGVKGAALAGCLKAAEQLGLKFVGYGGTSAGAIVALLAALGYDGNELKHITVDEIEFTTFLDDGGTALNQLQNLAASLSDTWRDVNGRTSKILAAAATARTAFTHRKMLGGVLKDLGLYDAHRLSTFLRQKIVAKIPDLEDTEPITFRHLAERGLPKLRIVSADLHTRSARVHSVENGAGHSVINAVRASMSYPFVFRPVDADGNQQVDGGISSNLPLSIFQIERIADQLPIVAFDLIAPRKEPPSPYSFGNFCGDMMATALESGEHLILDIMTGVHLVRVRIPEGIDTLDFSISREKRAQLFTTGEAATFSYFTKQPQWAQADTMAEWIQAQYAPEVLVVPILRAIAKEIQAASSAANVRTAVILPTGHGTQMVAYTYNYENDNDSDLEFDLRAEGFSEKIVYIDLEKTDLRTLWGLKREQKNKPRPDRKVIMHIPIFDRPLANSIGVKRSVNGLLSIDTSTPNKDLDWMTEVNKEPIVRAMQLWAEVFAKLLLRTY
jgi:NTE family protein